MKYSKIICNFKIFVTMLTIIIMKLCCGFQIPTYSIYLEKELGIKPEYSGYIMVISSFFYFVFSIITSAI